MSSPYKRQRKTLHQTNTDMSTPNLPTSTSPYMPMFQNFRAELDEHHDRRERVIKASRDVTALSKKIAKSLDSPIPAHIVAENKPRKETIASLLNTLLESDLAGSQRQHRYQRQVSPGMQELVEAAAFEYYLVYQRLPSPEELRAASAEVILLTEEDWLLGVFDAVGEMMRWAITSVAMSGSVPVSGEEMGVDVKVKDDNDAEGKGEEMEGVISENEVGRHRRRDMLIDMRELRAYLEGLETKGSGMHNAVEKKMDVMKQCVEKVENAVYGMIVRGRERPKGWVPETRDEVKTEAVESY